MKLVTYDDGRGGTRIGALTRDLAHIVDLDGACEIMTGNRSAAFADMLSLIAGGPAALQQARDLVGAIEEGGRAAALVPAGDVSLKAPVPVPSQMRDCLAFEKHYVQARAMRFRKMAAREPDPEAAWESYVASGQVTVPPLWYEQPIYYKQNRFSVVGPESEVLWPRYSQVMDFELEFGVFIGAQGKDIPRETARDHVFGFCIFNDFSARDAQAREMVGQLGPAKGKDFDTGNAMGPWLVTADEIADPYDLTMIARVNGEEWARGNTGEMHHRFEDIIAHVSADETLHPGEFLGSGTVGGGCGLELDRFLSDGDVVELEIDGLGILRNRVRRQD